MLLTLFLLHQSNITLNTLTLGGLAVAVGRLVDDSIVVIENIFRRLQKESFSKDIILDATKEVAVAITSSTLTTVAVLHSFKIQVVLALILSNCLLILIMSFSLPVVRISKLFTSNLISLISCLIS
ncbi:efflux RND transporter permease subunit [Escherichia coli]